jgi:hypothetical protein
MVLSLLRLLLLLVPLLLLPLLLLLLLLLPVLLLVHNACARLRLRLGATSAPAAVAAAFS